MKIVVIFALGCFFVSSSSKAVLKKDKTLFEVQLPEKGLCAHRGAMGTHPENTLLAFREAVKAGAHMIEFDVQLTKDNKMVVIHDGTVNRTTNGTGKVSELTFAEIRKLDVGSWKSPEFAGERIPTLDETLNIMPYNIWLNVHIKGEKDIAERIAKKLAEQDRLHQAFLACGAKAAEMARKAVSEILICNMDRRESNWDYVNETIEMKADFIQLRRKITPEYKEYVRALKENGIRVNYYGTDSLEEIRMLFHYGVDFPLVNDIVHSIEIAKELGIDPMKKMFPED
ncbi:MAG: glycerophosphodiester phosphodiesterase [Prolixibacteraceae bacterium]